jgi:hypothetical protein
MSATGIACAQEMPAAAMLARKKVATSFIMESLAELAAPQQKAISSKYRTTIATLPFLSTPSREDRARKKVFHQDGRPR